MAGREHMVRWVAVMRSALRMRGLIVAVQVRNEIAVLKKVSMGHQNILTLVDYFETMNNRMSGGYQAYLQSGN